MDISEIFIRTGGSENLICDPGIHRCGSIEDGITFRFENEKGVFVVNLSDLEKVVEEAHAARDNLKIEDFQYLKRD